LALIQWSYPAVCLLGTWLKRQHESVSDNAQRIYLAFDNDAAGCAATQRLRAVWTERAAALTLPNGVKDVGELAQRPDGRHLFDVLLR
jgi:DNA primase